jgi:hypothetical protein
MNVLPTSDRRDHSRFDTWVQAAMDDLRARTWERATGLLEARLAAMEREREARRRAAAGE